MIELVDIPSPRAVGIKISGKIDKAGLDKVIEVVEEKLAHTDKLGVYVELESFGGISWDALIENVKFSLPKIARFDKRAVVTDEEWMGKVAAFVDKLFWSMEIRRFPLAEKEEAKKWVAEPAGAPLEPVGH